MAFQITCIPVSYSAILTPEMLLSQLCVYFLNIMILYHEMFTSKLFTCVYSTNIFVNVDTRSTRIFEPIITINWFISATVYVSILLFMFSIFICTCLSKTQTHLIFINPAGIVYRYKCCWPLPTLAINHIASEYKPPWRLI